MVWPTLIAELLATACFMQAAIAAPFVIKDGDHELSLHGYHNSAGGHKLDSSTPLCLDIDLPTNTSRIEQGICILPIKHSVSSDAHHWVEPRQRPERTNTILSTDGKHKSWCLRDGPQPRQTDTLALCDKIDNTFIIARTRNIQGKYGNCVCQQWTLGTASYRACNCDRCDGLTVTDLKQNCRDLNAMCPVWGYASGYQVGGDSFVGILSGHRIMGGNMFEQIDDGMLERVVHSTCRSGDEERLGQDYTGPAIALPL